MYSQLTWHTLKMFKDSFLLKTNNMDCNNSNQEIISRLKFIGTLKKGDKFNTKHMFVQQSGLVTTISRTFVYQDSRQNAFNFCLDTVSRCLELLTTYERNEESQYYTNLLEDLKKSLVGIGNLQSTYIEDNKFCCDMETLSQKIQARLPIEYEKTQQNDTIDENNEK